MYVIIIQSKIAHIGQIYISMYQLKTRFILYIWVKRRRWVFSQIITRAMQNPRQFDLVNKYSWLKLNECLVVVYQCPSFVFIWEVQNRKAINLVEDSVYSTNTLIWTILCLIGTTTVTSVSAQNDKRYKTHPLRADVTVVLEVRQSIDWCVILPCSE